MKQYKRIMDIKDATFDSLEMLCNIEAEDGWRVITISDGSIHRYATLEKDYGTSEDSERGGLSVNGVAIRERISATKTGTRGNKDSTKR